MATRTGVFSGLISADASSIFSTSGSSLVGGSDSSLTQSSDVTFTLADGTATATVGGTVSLSGVFTRLVEGSGGELRPQAKQILKISLGSDPADTLGRALTTEDKITWNGLEAYVLGTAVPDGAGGYRVVGELTA